MIGRYAYVMIGEGACSLCDENTVYVVDQPIPVFDLMMLMLKDNANSCETYETNNSDDMSKWTIKSTFGEIMSEGLIDFKS